MIYAFYGENQLNRSFMKILTSDRNVKYREITAINDVIKEKELVLFIEEGILDYDFFHKNEIICKKINSLQWIVFLIGNTKKFKPLPYLIKRTRKVLRNQDAINRAIDLLVSAKLTPNSRENLFHKKMNRLFYIYYCLTDRDSVTYEEIAYVSGISKRTFQRDIEVLKEILITQKINYNEFEKCYTIEYI